MKVKTFHVGKRGSYRVKIVREDGEHHITSNRMQAERLRLRWLNTPLLDSKSKRAYVASRYKWGDRP